LISIVFAAGMTLGFLSAPGDILAVTMPSLETTSH
jgi:hypothetical protein